MDRFLTLLPCLLGLPALAQQPAAAPAQLTIYNGDFAVARTELALDLHAGNNEVVTTGVTSKLEPDSVVLRDVAGRHPFRILEQNYDAGVVNQQWLLGKFEGKTLDFQLAAPAVAIGEGGAPKAVPPQIVQGRVVRAGDDPLIEVNGHLQFDLPGKPLFPATTEGLLLKPTLRWTVMSDRDQHLKAELDYITHGMSWQASYNVVVPEKEAAGGTERADVLGWITMQNNSGTDFPQASIQLMAGDVAKLPQAKVQMYAMDRLAVPVEPPLVTQKAFDDFHLYDLHRTMALRDGESKQVQFLEAADVTVKRSYVFEGNQPIHLVGSHAAEPMLNDGGNQSVTIREQMVNSAANHLGMPLPAGRLRLYRRETTGQMQFVGESEVRHTPADQTLDVSSGSAFDLAGERRQISFHVDERAHTMEESFEVKLSNAKSQPVTIDDVEHMNRAQNWEITARSSDFTKRDASTVAFPVPVPAKGSTTLTYTVRYTW